MRIDRLLFILFAVVVSLSCRPADDGMIHLPRAAELSEAEYYRACPGGMAGMSYREYLRYYSDESEAIPVDYEARLAREAAEDADAKGRD